MPLGLLFLLLEDEEALVVEEGVVDNFVTVAPLEEEPPFKEDVFVLPFFFWITREPAIAVSIYPFFVPLARCRLYGRSMVELLM